MKTTDRYLFSLTLTYTFTTFFISFFSGNTLDLYISVYIVEYFIITLLHGQFNPRNQKIINITGYALFSIFLLIVAFKVLEILGGG
ncbi:MAG: hypothetical protein NWF01_11570 [Candidatus Bathyarchaeota archaeon]|nr:hypothetical protein [Candidatus Bathyarchaeota archaeon]